MFLNRFSSVTEMINLTMMRRGSIFEAEQLPNPRWLISRMVSVFRFHVSLQTHPSQTLT